MSIFNKAVPQNLEVTSCAIQKGEWEMTKVYTPLAKPGTCLTRSTPFFAVTGDDHLLFDIISHNYEIHRIP
jgi:hypothetical protein